MDGVEGEAWVGRVRALERCFRKALAEAVRWWCVKGEKGWLLWWLVRGKTTLIRGWNEG